MEIKLGCLRLNISFFAAVFFTLMLNGKASVLYLTVFVSAFVHELTHLYFFRKYGCRNVILDILPCGARFSSPEFVKLAYRELMICALSAPAVNIVIGIIFYRVFVLTGNNFFYDTAGVNLALGMGNLLPLSFLDGGRALGAFINTVKKTELPPEKYMPADIIFLLMLFVLCIVLFIRGKASLPLFAFTVYALLKIINTY